MKKTRKINKEEREILLNMQLRSKLSLLVLFYIFGLLLPLLTCMVITWNFHYFYFLIILGFLLYVIMFLFPKLEKNNYLSSDIRAFDSIVVSSSFCSFSSNNFFKFSLSFFLFFSNNSLFFSFSRI